MSKTNYRPADALSLLGALVAIEKLVGEAVHNLTDLTTGSRELALGQDVPLDLRRYYEKLSITLTQKKNSLMQSLYALNSEGQILNCRINNAVNSMNFNDDHLDRLSLVNTRLRVLEKSIRQLIDLVFKRVEVNDIELAESDCAYVTIILTINPDSERPSYEDDPWGNPGKMGAFKVFLPICGFISGKVNNDVWALDDGLAHNCLIDWAGPANLPFDQCYLFDELYNNVRIGLWGMMNIREITFDLCENHIGNFVI